MPLGSVVFTWEVFWKSISLKGLPSLQGFYLILCGHEQASRVSYPSKQISVGYHTPQNNFLQGIIPSGTNFFGVSDRCKQISARPYKHISAGVIPQRTNLRGVQGVYILEKKKPPPGEGISVDVIWGKKYEKSKRNRGKM